MNYPLISEYVQAIKLSEENFDKLTNLCPVFDLDGNPIMSSGNFAVVFKMQDKQTGKLYAVKCFLREQEGREESYKLISSELEYLSSGFLVSVKYLEKELFVDTTQGSETEFPVLIMDWVEGTTLDKYIRNNIHNRYNLSLVAYQFCRMASWLLSQEFAHGDLKPDNIIVREDGQLVLVDYDGMFVPAMKGQKARELGSVDYRHPLRAEDKFDSTIDDFSIASIALSLKAISLKPELLNEFGAEDRLLFSAKDYQNLGDSNCLRAIHSISNDVELAQLLGLFYIAYARNELACVSFRLFNIVKPEYVPAFIPEVELSTEVTDEDLENAIVDEYGVKYSRDGLRLLKAPDGIEKYKIKDGTMIICDKAFLFCVTLCELVILSSVTSIGDSAFGYCSSLRELVLPPSVTSIGNSAFRDCTSLRELALPPSVISIGNSAFRDCTSLRELVLPPSVISIGNEAFRHCTSLRELALPPSVISIGNSAFRDCISLRELALPSSVTNIGNGAFFNCSFLRELVLHPSVTNICNSAFNGCSSLNLIIQNSKFKLVDNTIVVDTNKREVISCLNNKSKIRIPTSVTSIGDTAFGYCSSLCELLLPPSVTNIGYGAFTGCYSLRELVIPSSVTSIGEGAFSGCSSLRELVLPPSVTNICNAAFYQCTSLCELVLHSSVTSIGNDAFNSCTSLCELVLPSSVTSIGNLAFNGCRSLRELVIPSSVTSIGRCAFSGCSSLRELVIPSLVTSIGDRTFKFCTSLRKLALPSSVTSIGIDALSYCESLQTIIVPKGQIERFKDLLKYSGCGRISIIEEQDE